MSGAAVKLWEELGKSSALFQLFLDDIWLDRDSDYFEENGNDIEHCVKYLEELIQIEKSIYNSAKNISQKSAEDYLEAFGVTPICQQLVNGLIASLKAISTSTYLGSQVRINAAKETLTKAIGLSDKLEDWRKDREKTKNAK